MIWIPIVKLKEKAPTTQNNAMAKKSYTSIALDAFFAPRSRLSSPP
jgi:hypothetical protein